MSLLRQAEPVGSGSMTPPFERHGGSSIPAYIKRAQMHCCDERCGSISELLPVHFQWAALPDKLLRHILATLESGNANKNGSSSSGNGHASSNGNDVAAEALLPRLYAAVSARISHECVQFKWSQPCLRPQEAFFQQAYGSWEREWRANQQQQQQQQRPLQQQPVAQTLSSAPSGGVTGGGGAPHTTALVPLAPLPSGPGDEPPPVAALPPYMRRPAMAPPKGHSPARYACAHRAALQRCRMMVADLLRKHDTRAVLLAAWHAAPAPCGSTADSAAGADGEMAESSGAVAAAGSGAGSAAPAVGAGSGSAGPADEDAAMPNPTSNCVADAGGSGAASGAASSAAHAAGGAAVPADGEWRPLRVPLQVLALHTRVFDIYLFEAAAESNSVVKLDGVAYEDLVLALRWMLGTADASQQRPMHLCGLIKCATLVLSAVAGVYEHAAVALVCICYWIAASCFALMTFIFLIKSSAWALRRGQSPFQVHIPHAGIQA